MPHRFCRGVTLIELIISIVILGITLGASISNLGALLKNSVDPVMRIQGYYIMKAYMDEISSKLATSPCSTSSGNSRTNFTVCDYSGLSEIPTNPAGVVMDGKSSSTYSNFSLPNLSNYKITVSIVSATPKSGSPGFTDDTDASSNTRNILKINVTGYYNKKILLGTLSTYVNVLQ